jgi:hypothetical protein
MSQYRTKAYKALMAQAATDYDDPTWPYAPLWRNRVGLRRIVASDAAGDAHGLLRSINRSTHRNEPDLDALLIEARRAVEAYAYAIARDNWDRLERKGLYSPEARQESSRLVESDNDQH